MVLEMDVKGLLLIKVLNFMLGFIQQIYISSSSKTMKIIVALSVRQETTPFSNIETILHLLKGIVKHLCWIGGTKSQTMPIKYSPVACFKAAKVINTKIILYV